MQIVSVLILMVPGCVLTVLSVTNSLTDLRRSDECQEPLGTGVWCSGAWCLVSGALVSGVWCSITYHLSDRHTDHGWSCDCHVTVVDWIDHVM